MSKKNKVLVETINEQIAAVLNISIYTDVPVLIISNPGMAKTTSVFTWAKANNWGCVGINGGENQPDDILGIPIPDKDSEILRRYKPDWLFKLEQEAAKYEKAVLFIDELTTANEYLQSPMLKIIFDRMVGQYKLPENVFVVAAGNYSQNLGTMFDLISPIVNRFMVYNLKSLTTKDREVFLKGPDSVNLDIYKFPEKRVSFDKEYINKLILDFTINYLETVHDFNGVDMADLYKNKDLVLNPATHRSIYYLSKLISGAVEIGYGNNQIILSNLVNGLIGYNVPINKSADRPKISNGDKLVTDVLLADPKYCSFINNPNMSFSEVVSGGDENLPEDRFDVPEGFQWAISGKRFNKQKGKQFLNYLSGGGYREFVPMQLLNEVDYLFAKFRFRDAGAYLVDTEAGYKLEHYQRSHHTNNKTSNSKLLRLKNIAHGKGYKLLQEGVPELNITPKEVVEELTDTISFLVDIYTNYLITNESLLNHPEASTRGNLFHRWVNYYTLIHNLNNEFPQFSKYSKPVLDKMDNKMSGVTGSFDSKNALSLEKHLNARKDLLKTINK